MTDRPAPGSGGDPTPAAPAGGDRGEGVPWRVFVTEAERRLRAAGLASAEVDARRIVEQASGYEGVELFVGLDQFATERTVAHFDAMLERRLAGEPLQYVLGSWSFRTLDLLVDDRVLIPRPETEQVVEVALREADRARSRRRPPTAVEVLDLGTGSGAIALSLAAERAWTNVLATDASPAALAVARANLAGIGRPAARVMLAEGDWFEAVPAARRGSFDVIVSNPPYVAEDDELPDEVRLFEPAQALISGPTGREAVEHLLAAAPPWLADDGSIVIEIAPHQAEQIADAARTLGYGRVAIERDLTGRERMVVAGRTPT